MYGPYLSKMSTYTMERGHIYYRDDEIGDSSITECWTPEPHLNHSESITEYGFQLKTSEPKLTEPHQPAVPNPGSPVIIVN